MGFHLPLLCPLPALTILATRTSVVRIIRVSTMLVSLVVRDHGLHLEPRGLLHLQKPKIGGTSSLLFGRRLVAVAAHPQLPISTLVRFPSEKRTRWEDAVLRLVPPLLLPCRNRKKLVNGRPSRAEAT